MIGEKGIKGDMGIRGGPGPKGSIGMIGPPGRQGDKGDEGKYGYSASKNLQYRYTKSCACNMHVASIIQVITCIIFGASHVQVQVAFISTCMRHACFM